MTSLRVSIFTNSQLVLKSQLYIGVDEASPLNPRQQIYSVYLSIQEQVLMVSFQLECFRQLALETGDKSILNVFIPESGESVPFFKSRMKQSKSLKLWAWYGKSIVTARVSRARIMANLIKRYIIRQAQQRFINNGMIQSNTESQLHTSGVKRRIDDLKKILYSEGTKQQSHQSMHHSVSSRNVEVTACHSNCNHTTVPLQQQAPIILQKQKTMRSSRKTIEKTKIPQIPQMMSQQRRIASKHKLVQAFEPIDIPLREKRYDSNIEQVIPCKPTTKQIQINIEKEQPDDKNKDCLKKLFKKISKLTGQLNGFQKENSRLKMEIEFQGKGERKSSELQKQNRDLETDRHKLRLQLATLKEMLALQKSRPPQIIEKIVNQPIEIIKQVPVEKIVEVKVQVIKHVPGPERIVEKRVEVPKIIEVQKKIPVEIIKEVIKQVPRQIIKTVQVPTYIDRPVYIDKPVYVDRIVQNKVEVPVQVPFQVPVYIDRPVYESQPRDSSMQQEIKFLLAKNTTLQSELSNAHRHIQQYRLQVEELYRNIEILRRHNEDKNREVESLIQNSFDQYNSMDVMRMRHIPLGSPLPPSVGAGSYLTNNYTISSDSIPPFGARPRFI